MRNLEEYRVTRSYERVPNLKRSEGGKATITISMRVEAYSHTQAADLVDREIRHHILNTAGYFKVLQIAVQSPEQIKTGEVCENPTDCSHTNMNISVDGRYCEDCDEVFEDNTGSNLMG